MVETLFTHPRILVPGGSAEAVLVRDGDIVAVGARTELREAFAGAPEVPLPGAAVVAGFHDAHVHTGSVARDLASVELRGSASVAEAIERLGAHLRLRPGTGWVTGGYWDANEWPTGIPTRHELERLCPDRPIALASLDGHSVWMNTIGLRRAGIDASTPDPVGGVILRESDGREPAGVLRESACDAVRELAERELDPELPELLAQVQQRFLALGITQVTDLDERATRMGFERMRADGTLRLRVHKGVPQADLEQALAERWRTGSGDRWITQGPVKLFADGALGSHSAHMGSDFADDPGNAGIEVLPAGELDELVRRANAAGIAVATHAIGDRANRQVLDAYERHADLTRSAGLRNRIEHAQHIDPVDLPRFAELGVVASLQPTHCTTDFALAGRRIGGRRLANYAWRALLDLGARVAFGSDTPIEPANPMYGVHAAVTRKNREGEPTGGFEPGQRVSVGEALSLYSAGAAYAAGIERRVGRIAEGQYADFVALDTDPYTAEPDRLWEIGVAATIVDGEIVYHADD